MRKRLVRRAFTQKMAQRLPTISIFPTHHQQVLPHSSVKILEHRAIVSFISLRGLLVIPRGRLLALDLIPPVRLNPVCVSDSLALVMSLQTAHVSRSVFPQREDKL